MIPTSGKIIVNGKEFDSMTPQLASENGIAIIYQEFNNVKELSAAENLFLGHPIRKGILIDKKAMEEQAAKAFEQLHIKIDPKTLMKDLTVGYQQMVEIAKAIQQNARILIMDEPSAPLTSAEVESMFGVVELLRKQGVSIIYISHRLEEIYRLSDRIVVIRDGEYVTTLITKDSQVEELIQLMVGRELTETYPPRGNCINKNEVVLELKNLTGNGDKNINLKLHRGEILGLGGLVGAGRDSHFSVIDEKLEMSTAVKYQENMAIKTPSLHQLIRNLSGGNQQKVILGRWMAAQSELIIFDEPTRGIDIGAKYEIYKLMNDLVEKEGKSILMISSEMEELMGMSDRILVLAEGEMTGELSKEEFSQETIMTYASAAAKE